METDDTANIITALETISKQMETISTRLEVVETQNTGDTAQNIDAVSRMFDHPIAGATLAIAVLLVGVPFARKYLDKRINGYGTSRGGKQITLSDVQRHQIKMLRDNSRILKKLAKRFGLCDTDLPSDDDYQTWIKN